jgi:hypothetical protein
VRQFTRWEKYNKNNFTGNGVHFCLILPLSSTPRNICPVFCFPSPSPFINIVTKTVPLQVTAVVKERWRNSASKRAEIQSAAPLQRRHLASSLLSSRRWACARTPRSWGRRLRPYPPRGWGRPPLPPTACLLQRQIPLLWGMGSSPVGGWHNCSTVFNPQKS